MTYLEYYKKKIYKHFAEIATPPTGHKIESWELKNKILRFAGLNIGKNTSIGPGLDYLIGYENNITFEDYVCIGNIFRIWAFNEVSIGSFTLIAADVSCVNGWHDKNTFEPSSGKLRIGKGCWIGNGARIVGALNIGNNVIIGAGATVVSDLPENAIAVGAPARIIGYRELPEKVWYFNNLYFSPKTFTLV